MEEGRHTLHQGFPATTSQAAFQVLGKVSSRYTVGDAIVSGEKLKLYKESTNYKNQSPNSPDKNSMWLAENSFWLDEKGRIVRQEIKIGIDGAKQFSSNWIDLYDYDPKGIKIEAPPIK